MASRPLLANNSFRKERLSISFFLMTTGLKSLWLAGNMFNFSQNTKCEFESHSWRGVIDTALCDKVCWWFAKGRWVSPGTPVSSTNKTDRYNWNIVVIRDYYMTFSISALVSARDSHIMSDSDYIAIVSNWIIVEVYTYYIPIIY